MFTMGFETGNAAFDDLPVAEVQRVLRLAADHLEPSAENAGSRPAEGLLTIQGYCRDSNGNTVGNWTLVVEAAE